MRLLTVTVLLLLFAGSLSAQTLSFQTLKGKKYKYQVTVPAGNYEHDVYSSEQESWGGTNEPYVHIDAQKNIDYPDGPNWSAKGGMYGFAKRECQYNKGEIVDFTETKKEIRDGYKYEAHFFIKTPEETMEYYVIGAVLSKGKYKFDERKWIIADLIFHKPSADKEAIVKQFFESFGFGH